MGQNTVWLPLLVSEFQSRTICHCCSVSQMCTQTHTSTRVQSYNATTSIEFCILYIVYIWDIHSTVAPLRTIVLFYISNNLNALMDITQRKLPYNSLHLATGLYASTTRACMDPALITMEPVDNGERLICRPLYSVGFSGLTWFCFISLMNCVLAGRRLLSAVKLSTSQV